MPERTDQIQEPLIVWRIVDGKPGHESQTDGLVQALSDLRLLEAYDIQALGRFQAMAQWAIGKFEQGKDLPKPDLILGAGHRTHFSVLAARKAFGGKAIVLMKPSLPLGWFDLCLIPEHDAVAEAPHVVTTRGALNTVRPATTASDKKGLILVGGPSAHHDWDSATLLAQVAQLVQVDRGIQWTLTTSPRTLEATEKALVGLDEPNLESVPFAQTQRGWVAERLQECALAWVSEDSVSMVYEALTAGARVGLLTVPAKGAQSRVLRGVEELLADGFVARFESVDGDIGRHVDALSEPFCEADRCAKLVLKLVSRS